MGRILNKESIGLLKTKCVQAPDVQVIISDGLSTDAITANYDEILPPLMKGLEQSGLKVGTPFFVRYGRVKIEDQAGEVLGAKVVILLVGERRGWVSLKASPATRCTHRQWRVQWKQTVPVSRTFTAQGHRRWKPPLLSSI